MAAPDLVQNASGGQKLDINEVLDLEDVEIDPRAARYIEYKD